MTHLLMSHIYNYSMNHKSQQTPSQPRIVSFIFHLYKILSCYKLRAITLSFHLQFTSPLFPLPSFLFLVVSCVVVLWLYRIDFISDTPTLRYILCEFIVCIYLLYCSYDHPIVFLSFSMNGPSIVELSRRVYRVVAGNEPRSKE